MKEKFSWERFSKIPIVGIARNISYEDLVDILPLYRSSGLTTVEVTMNSSKAEDIIRYALDEYAGDLNVGAGTVCNLDNLDKALSAGAQFIVTPVIDEQVIQACVEKQVPIFPGAFTPTEIYKAWAAGADMVKVFPAGALGYKYIKDVKGPLNQIKLMATGGVDLDNCTDFLKAGATGLGIGSELFDKNYIKEKNWEALAEHFVLFVKKINAFMNS